MKRKKHRQSGRPGQAPAAVPVSSTKAGSEPHKSGAPGKHSEFDGIPRFLTRAWAQGWLPALILLAAIAAAYLPVRHAGFVWDDDAYVTENPLLTAPDGLRRIWFSPDSPSQYFPLTYTIFYFERALWGLNPAGYHWTNLLFHAANALLAWRLLARLRVPGAWLAAAVFALHPVQVESVAWITERKNVLMGFFFLSALLAWLAFIEEKRARPWRFYALALVCYALALSAKTTACTLPAALLLVLWLKRMPVNSRRIAQVVPFVVLGAGMGLVTIWWEHHHQGTAGRMFEIGPVERVLIAARAVWFYAGKLLWPAKLTFSYPRWKISAADASAWGWVLATAALGVAIWRVRRWTGRSVEVAALFFAATLAPVLGFIMLYTFAYSFVADHYQYLACLGPIALAAAGVELGLGRMARRGPVVRPVLCAALLLVCGVLTWRQCGMYADAQTLWRATLVRNPSSWLAHHNLGLALAREGKLEPAIAEYQTVLDMNPGYADAHNDLGVVLARVGRVDEAIDHYRMALQFDTNRAEIHYDLANALMRKGKLDEAVARYQTAIELRPGYVEAHINLGTALLQQGHSDAAIRQYEQALQLRPDFAGAWATLGQAAWILSTSPEAGVRNGAKAVELAQHASELAGGANPQMLATLAAAYAEAGRFPEALTTVRDALRIATNGPDASLAGALRAQAERYQSGLPFHNVEPATGR